MACFITFTALSTTSRRTYTSDPRTNSAYNRCLIDPDTTFAECEMYR